FERLFLCGKTSRQHAFLSISAKFFCFSGRIGTVPGRRGPRLAASNRLKPPAAAAHRSVLLSHRRMIRPIIRPPKYLQQERNRERTTMRHATLRALALFAALCGGMLFPVSVLAQSVAAGDLLPSWNEGPAKQAIFNFVRATIDRSS